MFKRRKSNVRRGRAQAKKLKKKSSLRFKVPAKQLVFHTDGCTLYAAIAGHSVVGEVQVEEPVFSRATEPETAVAEIVEALTARGQKVPKTAVLITPSVISDIVYLPVNPRKKRKRGQMEEVIRWELEETFAAQGDLWSLGAILQGRGLITQQQREGIESGDTPEDDYSEVDDIIEEDLEDDGGKVAFSSVSGGFANFVTPEELEETLNLQEFLSGMDDELVTGCCYLNSTGEDGQFLWYGVGVGDGLRSRWAKACKKNKIHLKALYPSLGAALPAICSIRTEQWLFVDVQSEQYAIYTGSGSEPASMVAKSVRYGRPVAAVIADEAIAMLQGETRNCFLSGPAQLLPEMVDALTPHMDERGGTIAVCGGGEGAVAEDADCPWWIRQSMEGAAARSFSLCEKTLLVGLGTREKRGSIFQDRDVVLWGVIGLLAAIGTLSYFILSYLATVQSALHLKSRIQYDKSIEAKRQAEQVLGEIRSLETQLAAVEKEVKIEEHNIEILDKVVRKRQKLVPEFLRAMSKVTPPEILLDSVRENSGRRGFFISGWAATDTVGQKYLTDLNLALTPLGYRVEGGERREGMNDFTMKGYILEIQIVKVPDAAAVKTQSPANKKR